jgi:hypothetical protein
MSFEQEFIKMFPATNDGSVSMIVALVVYAILLNFIINVLVLFRMGRIALFIYILLTLVGASMIIVSWNKIVKFKNDKERELKKLDNKRIVNIV